MQEVYQVATWLPAGSTFFSRGMLDDSPGRWEFVGQKAPEEIRNKDNDHSVEHLFPKSAQNPIKYVNV
ncbi:hypothetical protein HNR44_003043 [Geomicrobium halophilum]|uniref:Uncharacterized protein n=1 Tax=Geomicrobium halophilum TaxID=549000 RepID=A0A841PQM5_9BACL|nr:hypothetical protein [Geomicrobium halophilum]MBB6451049.1 hypothetical protein [Geomicrobium halophilum]